MGQRRRNQSFLLCNSTPTLRGPEEVLPLRWTRAIDEAVEKAVHVELQDLKPLGQVGKFIFRNASHPRSTLVLKGEMPRLPFFPEGFASDFAGTITIDVTAPFLSNV